MILSQSVCELKNSDSQTDEVEPQAGSDQNVHDPSETERVAAEQVQQPHGQLVRQRGPAEVDHGLARDAEADDRSVLGRVQERDVRQGGRSEVGVDE